MYIYISRPQLGDKSGFIPCNAPINPDPHVGIPPLPVGLQDLRLRGVEIPQDQLRQQLGTAAVKMGGTSIRHQVGPAPEGPADFFC